MRKTILMLLLAVVSGSAVAEWTGADWNGWTRERKVMFLEGFVAGSQWVASNAMGPFFIPDETIRSYAKSLWEQSNAEYSQALKNPKDRLPPKYSANEVILIMMYDGFQKNPLFERQIISIPVQQVSDRVDTIFKEPQNRRMPLTYAIYLAKRIVGGLTVEDMNILLPYLRGENRTPPLGIIPVYDSNKKFVKVIEFP